MPQILQSHLYNLQSATKALSGSFKHKRCLRRLFPSHLQAQPVHDFVNTIMP